MASSEKTITTENKTSKTSSWKQQHPQKLLCEFIMCEITVELKQAEDTLLLNVCV